MANAAPSTPSPSLAGLECNQEEDDEKTSTNVNVEPSITQERSTESDATSIPSHIDGEEKFTHGQAQGSSGVDVNPLSAQFIKSLVGTSLQQAFFDCASGDHVKLWYMYKRFEKLGLLNLYYYQHELIELEAKIAKPPDGKAPGPLETGDILDLRRLLREYAQATHDYKEMLLMPRPLHNKPDQICDELQRHLQHAHYSEAVDAHTLMDLTPKAFGVPPDNSWLPWKMSTQEAAATPHQRGLSHLMQIFFSFGRNAPRAQSDTENQENSTDSEQQQRKDRHAKRLQDMLLLRVQYRTGRVMPAYLISIALMAPLQVMYFIDGVYRLLMAFLCTVVFAGVLAAATRANVQELATATAGYCAVLMVFVGASLDF